MSIFLALTALLIGILLIFRRKIALRRKIKKIIKKHPSTVNYLKRGVFQKHELIKSLRGKVIDELSNVKIKTDRNKLYGIIEKEIQRELRGWREKTKSFIKISGGVIGVGFLIFIMISYNIGRNIGDERAGKEQAGLLHDYDKGKGEIKAEKNEENYQKGMTLLNNGKPRKAIKQFKKVSEHSDKYHKAKKQIKNIKRNLYIEESIEIPYKELQKRPDDFKGKIIHFYGRIYNIQEVKEKTVLSLSTSRSDDIYIGDEALILFPNKTPLNEGDYINLYGSMMGSYSNNHEEVGEYLKNNKYTIYFDQRTFIEQVPVLNTKIITDVSGNIYE